MDREVLEVGREPRPGPAGGRAFPSAEGALQLKDDEIARRIARADPAAFDALFDRYAGPLLGYLRGMTGDRQTAEDLLQETMLRVFRRIGKYEERGAFRSWVFRIATNLAITELRRARFRADWNDEAARALPDARAAHADEALEREETSRELRRAIATLPDEQRAVILLRTERGLEIREIARALSVPEGTVKSRLHYAVRSLRHFMCERAGSRPIGGRMPDAMR